MIALLAACENGATLLGTYFALMLSGLPGRRDSFIVRVRLAPCSREQPSSGSISKANLKYRWNREHASANKKSNPSSPISYWRISTDRPSLFWIGHYFRDAQVCS